MIVKYLKGDVWGFIDNVRQIATKNVDTEDSIRQYNEEVEKGEREDIASFMNGEKSTVEVSMSNKVFLMATENDLEDIIGDVHRENLLDPLLTSKNYPAKTILLYLNDHKEHHNVVLITNQTTYLMNDKGQTIERLV